MDQWSRDNDVTCRLDGCDNPPGKRSAYCSVVHRIEGRRASKRDYMRRERGWTDTLDDPKIPQSGRSIPRSPDSWTPPTICHPSRKFARRNEPEVISYLEPGSTARRSAMPPQAPRTDLQRYRAPHRADAESWAPEAAKEYYSRVDFRARNDMSSGPYHGGYVAAGSPAAFHVVVRGTRR
jgi:hypothetical protein